VSQTGDDSMFATPSFQQRLKSSEATTTTTTSLVYFQCESRESDFVILKKKMAQYGFGNLGTSEENNCDIEIRHSSSKKVFWQPFKIVVRLSVNCLKELIKIMWLDCDHSLTEELYYRSIYPPMLAA